MVIRGTKLIKEEAVRTPQKTVAEQVLKICKETPEGVRQELIGARLPQIPQKQQADAINYLLKQQQLELHQRDGALLFKYVVQEQAAKFKGLSSDELLVYQIIKASANIGIWTRDLKVKSNLQQNQVVKVLKVLESRKLVKAIKSVQNKNRKVYMDFDTEPAREVTGGAWYTDNEFDNEYIEALQNTCRKFVNQRKSGTIEEIRDYITENKISTVPLTSEDIKSIMNILVYDGELDEKVGANLVYIPSVSKRQKTDLSIQILNVVSKWPEPE